MQRAWRERTPSIRIQLARDALEKNSEYKKKSILLKFVSIFILILDLLQH